MTTPGVAGKQSVPALSLGLVNRIRVQVGYRDRPDGTPYEQFLLDLPLTEDDGTPAAAYDDRPWLTALEPVVYAGSDAPMHYSIHAHRWHTTWGPNPGTLELGVTVTTGPRRKAATRNAVVQAFRSLAELGGGLDADRITREAAIVRARRAVVDAYAVAPDALSLAAEEHDAAHEAWTLDFQARELDAYAVVVGFLDGFPGAIHVTHEPPREVLDSVGTE